MPAGLKGVVLAAGLGTRLRPLTERYAKPLIPFLGTTPLELALWRLKNLGIKEVAVNSHYHADQLAAAVEAKPLGFALKLSHEPEILGTGGCYNPLESWQGDDALLVINGDVVSDVDVFGLWKRHQESGALATMALLPDVIPGESAVFSEAGLITGIGRSKPTPGSAPGNYACVQVLSRAFIELLPKTGSFDVISQGYLPAIAQGHKVSAFVHEGVWHDIRNPAYYWLAVKDFLGNEAKRQNCGIDACRAARGLQSLGSGSTLFDQSVKLGAGVKLSANVMLEPGSEIGAGASLEDCLVLPDGKVLAGAVEKNAIIGGNLRVSL